jgi:hypothetical protein
MARNLGLRAAATAALALVLAAASAGAVTLTEKSDRTYPLGPRGEFALENVNGSVDIEAWDRDEVRVEAEKKVKARSRERAQQALGALKIEVDQGAGRLSVATRMPKSGDGIFDWLWGTDVQASVSYRIKVPRHVTVDAATTNGALRLAGTEGEARARSTNGRVRIENVSGEMTVRTTNGGIEVVDSAGSVNARTTNGGIRVELADVTPGSEMTFTTTNGGVSLTLPADVRATLDAATSNGSIVSDFPVLGDARRSSRHHLSGEVNGGGGLLKIRTTNGGVRIGQG